MRDEGAVPLEERVLVLEGALEEQVFREVKRALPPGARSEESFFVRYAYADIPLPRTYEIIFDYDKPSNAEFLPVEILAATQQFATAEEEIPHGWKMICWLGPSALHSKLLQSLPKVSTWFESARAIGISSRETWEAKLKQWRSRTSALAPTVAFVMAAAPNGCHSSHANRRCGSLLNV